jgi:hypothetical protein
VTPGREAFGLPLLLLTVTLVGGVRLTEPVVIQAPALFALVLATLLMAVFAQSGVLAPERLVNPGRATLANLNGLLVLLTLFVASAQVISRLTPDSGLPALAMNLLFFVTVLQLGAAALDRLRCLRMWAVTLLSAFAIKYIVLAALAGPSDRPLARALQALVDGVTLGGFAQPAEGAAAGYLAFGMLAMYALALAMLPTTQRHALVVRH